MEPAETNPPAEGEPRSGGRPRGRRGPVAHDLPPAIQWHEGMLLAPQHFQQLSLREEALLHYHATMISPFHWGVRHLKIDPVLLVDGTFRVLELEAVMPDGLVVSAMADESEELTADLAPHLETLKQRQLTIHLAVAARRPGLSPVEGEMARYSSVAGEAVVDENTGEGEVQVPRLVPRLRLLLTDDPPPKFASFPLARVAYRNETFALAKFVPPLLRVPLRSPLGELGTAVARRLREKAVFLSEKVRSPSAATRVPQLLETRALVGSLVSALPPFEAVLGTGLSHPYALYLALCSLVGQVAAVGHSLVPPVLDAYDHNDLYACFEHAQKFIFQALDEGIIESYTGYPFYLEEGAFLVTFDPAWVGRALVLGVRAREGASESEVDAWVEASLVSSRSKIPILRAKRIVGAPRKRIAGDRDLVPSRGVSLYALTADPEFVVPDELLEIRNLDDPQGKKRPVEIVLYVRNQP